MSHPFVTGNYKSAVETIIQPSPAGRRRLSRRIYPLPEGYRCLFALPCNSSPSLLGEGDHAQHGGREFPTVPQSPPPLCERSPSPFRGGIARRYATCESDSSRRKRFPKLAPVDLRRDGRTLRFADCFLASRTPVASGFATA